MKFSPSALHLASLLDDSDESVGVNALVQLLAREEELGDLPGLLQESSDPLVRRRAHMLQNAIAMRRRRRELCRMLDAGEHGEIFDALTALHLLWYDKDRADEIGRDVNNFFAEADKHPLFSLEDAEFFMRKCCFLPENESTIRPEAYCIGTALYQKCGATSLWMAVIYGLLPENLADFVRINGQFGLLDKEGFLLTGGGNWRLQKYTGGAEKLSLQQMMRYFAVTLLSCAVNSDSYRYVMTITQSLTGDESKHVFDDFPYPFLSNPEFLSENQPF